MRRPTSSAPGRTRQPCRIAGTWRTAIRQNASILAACLLTLGLAGVVAAGKPPADTVVAQSVAR